MRAPFPGSASAPAVRCVSRGPFVSRRGSPHHRDRPRHRTPSLRRNRHLRTSILISSMRPSVRPERIANAPHAITELVARWRCDAFVVFEATGVYDRELREALRQARITVQPDQSGRAATSRAPAAGSPSSIRSMLVCLPPLRAPCGRDRTGRHASPRRLGTAGQRRDQLVLMRRQEKNRRSEADDHAMAERISRLIEVRSFKTCRNIRLCGASATGCAASGTRSTLCHARYAFLAPAGGATGSALSEGRSATRSNHALIWVLAGSMRLADLGAEIEPAIEQDVGERKALAAEIFPPVRHLAVEPLQAVGGDHLQPRRGFGDAPECAFRKISGPRRSDSRWRAARRC